MRTVFLILTLLLGGFTFAQNNIAQSDTSTILVGKISPILGNLSLTKSKAASNGKYQFRIDYAQQDGGSKKTDKTFSFFATEAELNNLFDQIKQVFKDKKNTAIPLGNNKEIGLNMITVSDIQFSIYENNRQQGSFSTSATGFHLLFGKPLRKQAWKAYLTQ